MTNPPTVRATVAIPAAEQPRVPTSPPPPTVQVRPLIALAGNTALAAGETVAAVGGAPAFAVLAAVTAVGAVGTVMSRTHAHRARRAAARRTFRGSGGSGRSGSGGGLGRLFGGRPSAGHGRASGSSAPATTGRAGGSGRTAGSAVTGRRAGRPPGTAAGTGTGTGGTSSTGRRSLFHRRRNQAAGKSGGAYDPGVPDTKRRRWRRRGDEPAAGHDRKTKAKGRGKKADKDRLLTTGPQPIPPPRSKPAGPRIAPKVTPIDTAKPATPAPPAKPATATSGRSPDVSTAAASGGTPVTSPHRNLSPLLAIKAIIEDEFPKIIAQFHPEGIEEVVDEYGHYPEVIEALAGVWTLLRTICEADYPLHPVIAGLLDTIAKHQRAVGTTTAEVPGLIKTVHAKQFDDMADRRNAMWDHRANPQTAAQPKPAGS